jgi:hypothetical protein
VADLNDPHPELVLIWPNPVNIQKLVISFDTDFDHPMETSIWGHPENVVPFVVKVYKILNDQGQCVHQESQNHQTRNEILFEPPITTTKLVLQFRHPSAKVPAAVFGIDIN